MSRLSLLLLMLLLCSGTGYASSPAPPAPCPSTSLCLDQDEVRRALVEHERLRACEAEATVMRDQHEAEMAAARADEQAERFRADRLAQLLADATTPAPASVSWWQEPAFVIALGIVAAGALTAVVVLAVD